jgi:molybdate transport system substrate-binding protein
VTARSAVAAVALALVVAACGRGREASPSVAPERSLTVLAASSLTDVLPPLGARFEQVHDARVSLRFGASSTLARQIEEGAPSDVFVSADAEWIDALIALERAHGDARRPLASNRLVAVVPADSGSAPSDLAALAALPRIAVASPEVPAGMHALAAFERAGLLVDARPRFVQAADVRAALAWAARGEADAAVVYATDARIEPRVRQVLELETATPIVYEAIPIEPAEHGALARAWIEFVRTDPACIEAFRSAGFAPPPPGAAGIAGGRLEP